MCTYIYFYLQRDRLWKHQSYRNRRIDLGSTEWEARTCLPRRYVVGLWEDVQLTVYASVRSGCRAARQPLYKSLVAAGAVAWAVQVKLTPPVQRQQKPHQLHWNFLPVSGDASCLLSPVHPMQWMGWCGEVAGAIRLTPSTLGHPWGGAWGCDTLHTGCWVGSEWAEGLLQKLGRGKLWAGIVGTRYIFLNYIDFLNIFPSFEMWRICLLCGPIKHFWTWDSGNRVRRGRASPSLYTDLEAQGGEVMREERKGWKQQMLVHLYSQIWKQSSLIYVHIVSHILAGFWKKEE